MATIKDLLSKMIEKTNENTSEITGLKENGISCGADWNQNDENAKDYIKNKPFGEKTVMGDTLSWDGNTEGKITVTDKLGWSFPCTKISDATPTMTDIGKGVEYCFKNGAVSTSNNIFNTENAIRLDGNVYIALKDNVTYEDGEGFSITFPEKGTYFVSDLRSFTINGYNGFPTTGINHLDPKYIKDMYYTGDPVETPIVEETTFELVDGVGQLIAAQPLEVGQEYVINLDGVQYNVMCKEINLDGMIFPYLGNLVVVSDSVDTGEPFFVAPMDSNTELGIMVNSDVAEHTVSIIGNIADIHHIDSKYIKDMYYEYIAPNTDFVLDAYFNAEEDNWWFYSDYFGLESFLVEGATYIVNCNDETYTCTARRNNYGNVYIGNQAIVDGDEGTFPEIIESNEPFFLYTFEEEFDYGLCMQTAGEYSIVIRGTGEKLTPRKIDMKYMPNSIMWNMRDQWNAIDNIYNNFDNKMNKNNPTGTGSFSMNRKAGTTVGTYSHAEGKDTTASGEKSHAEGHTATASGNTSHAEGYKTTASGTGAHAEGYQTTASGDYSHAEGYAYKTSLSLTGSANSTSYKVSKKNNSIKIGRVLKYNNTYAKITNYDSSTLTITTDTTLSSTALSKASVELLSGVASGKYSHAEGASTTASGGNSHAEGNNTTASGDCSHAEGTSTEASGGNSHAEGHNTIASGLESHAEGNTTIASGNFGSHSEGYYTIASGEYQHVQGKYNAECPSYYIIRKFTIDNFMPDSSIWVYDSVELNYETSEINAIGGANRPVSDSNISYFIGNYFRYNHGNIQGVAKIVAVGTKNGDNVYYRPFCDIEVYHRYEITTAHIVGNGESDTARSNAHTLDWEGNAWYAGDVYTGSTSGTNKDKGSKKLASEEYVDTKFTNGFDALILLSPNGTRFNITVGDDGVLSATEITE